MLNLISPFQGFVLMLSFLPKLPFVTNNAPFQGYSKPALKGSYLPRRGKAPSINIELNTKP
jgi:hypothetical protein